MKNILILIALVLVIVSTSCEKLFGPREFDYEIGSLPETPVNLSGFNTEYDYYNSTSATIEQFVLFCFSTNRNSNGNDFDIIYQPMNIHYSKQTGELKVTNEHTNADYFKGDYENIVTGINKIKTTGNEFGPNIIRDYSSGKIKFTFLYSTDVSGSAQINYISNISNNTFSEPKEVEFLNSEFDDMYPTFNSDKSRIYFCSNRKEDNFDFYYIDVDPERDIEQLLSESSSYEIHIDSNISSSSDDKCPFIYSSDNKMVFASNRDGGYGGYDLYYSILENGEWSEPINFGDKINTEFDEYRPILINDAVSENQTMMVFSSNRTGGFGGFDLYYVGILN